MSLEWSAIEEESQEQEQFEIMSRDIDIYQTLRDETEKSKLVLDSLKKEHSEIIELMALADGNGDESFEAAEKIGELKNTNVELYHNVMLARLPEYFKNLQDEIRNYITSIHTGEIYSSMFGSEISKDVKTRISEFGRTRSYAHDALISRLRMIGRIFQNAGLDNSWLSVVGFSNGQERRAEVQRWAKNVSDYLVTISETTKKNGGNA